MRIPAKVTYALLLSTLLVSCCLNTGSIEPVEENEQIALEDLVIYEATEGRDDDSTAIGIAVVGLVVVAAVPLPIAAGIMYVWASSLASDAPEEGTRNVYNANDATSSTSDGGGDDLMKLTFSYSEDDLNWAFVDIKLEVGDNVYDCGFAVEDDCWISEQVEDGAWGATEHITLSEGTDNIVGAWGAEVNIYVKYRNAQVSGDSSVYVN
jgi:hypothetical protein